MKLNMQDLISRFDARNGGMPEYFNMPNRPMLNNANTDVPQAELAQETGGFQKGLLDFLQTPQAMAMAAGLLSSKSPTLGGALGEGLQAYNAANQPEDPYKNLYRQMNLKLMESQINDLQQQQMAREKQDQILGNVAGNLRSGSAANLPVTAEQRQRANFLFSVGDNAAAIKALTEKPEKPEKDKTQEATQATITQNQNVVSSADNMLPVINKLLQEDVPNQFFGKYINPNQQASYEADVITIAEGLLGARNLPQTQGSLDAMKLIAQRQTFETADAYKKRMYGLKQEVIDRKKEALKITNIGGKQALQEEKKETNDPLGLFK